MDSINTERSYTEYKVTEPTTDFGIGFDNYSGEDKDAIHVTLDGVNLDNLDYTVVRKNAQVIEVTPAIASGVVRLQRETYIDQAFHNFTAGALFSPKSMDENFAQIRHSQQEVTDGFTFLSDNTLGVVAAAETATDRANAAADTIDDLAVGIVNDTLVTTEQGVSLREKWDIQFDSSGIFGQTGVKFLAQGDASTHCGWGSCIEFASGKVVFIYRRAANHAIGSSATMWAKDSYDGGKTWINHRQILSSDVHDLRPDPLCLMGNNRAGTFINRSTSTSGAFYSPYFLSTDDEGVSWQTVVVPTNSPYTFQSTGGLIDYPASVGGHDTLGFIAYGFLSGGGLDALTTKDNGVTWQAVHEVAVPSGEVTALSEWSGVRLGNTDRWVFTTRSRVGSAWNPKMIVWVTNNPLNWGTWHASGLGLNGNPPAMIYDDGNDTVTFLAPSRSSRVITGYLENALLECTVPADIVYTTNGNVGAVYPYRTTAVFPEWFTSYLAPTKIRGRWVTALTCAEYGGAEAVQLLVGDFTTTAGELTYLVQLQMQNNSHIRKIDTLNNLELSQIGTGYPFIIRDSVDGQVYTLFRSNGLLIKGTGKYTMSSNQPISMDNKLNVGTASDANIALYNARITASVDSATAPAFASVVGSTSARKHTVFGNSNGVVGSITTSDMSTTYSTTSDYRVKTTHGLYSDALQMVNAIPVYSAVFNTLPDAEPQPMVLAHELQAVYKHAVVGEKDAVNEDGMPDYQQVDYSKLVPLLVRAIQELTVKVHALDSK